MKTNLLKLTCTLVGAMACVSVNAQNYCGYPNEEDVTWEFNDNQLVFQGTGAIKEYSHDMPTAYPWFAHYEDVQSVIIGEGITSIPAWAFAMYENLRSIQLPSTLKTIGWSCLEETNVWNVALPEGLEKIESYAFMMTPFSSVSIPSTVTEIGERAFGYCDDLLSIGCYADAPPTLGDNAFGDSPIATVYVKSENTATYKVASGWADFGDKIQSPAGYCGPNGSSGTCQEGQANYRDYGCDAYGLRPRHRGEGTPGSRDRRGHCRRTCGDVCRGFGLRWYRSCGGDLFVVHAACLRPDYSRYRLAEFACGACS